MQLLLISLLCSFCLLGSGNQASTDEADCDDPNVFLAADAALRSYNDAKEVGNQFVLYRITEARKKEETGRVHIFFKSEIKESVCQVKNGINWQQCAFKENEGDNGECSAHVLVNVESKVCEIYTQNCSIRKVLEPPVTAVEHTCLGCFNLIDTNSETLLPIVRSAIKKMNRVGNHKFHFDIENLTKAERQVVSGWNYNLQYKIQQTNCSKSLFPEWTPEECSLDQNGQHGDCFTSVFVTPNEEIRDLRLDCHSSTGFCLSCPDEVEKEDPELLNLLKQFTEEYNSNNNHTHLYELNEVQKATRKLVQNQKQYKAEFKIQVTNCSKSDHSILGEECDTEPMNEKLYCTANFHVVNETVDILPDYKCHVSPPEVSARIVIKGLSPLRMMPSLGMSRSRKSRSSGKSKQKEKEHKNGKKEKKDKKEKKGKKHDGKYDHSSEESAEDDRKKPQVLPPPAQEIPQVPEIDTSVLITPEQSSPVNEEKVPDPPVPQPPTPSTSLPLTTAIPEKQGTYPNIQETFIFDLPGPENVPKCPGKIWQPLLPFLPIATEKSFVIEGLTFNDDDLLPKSEKQFPGLDTAGLFTDDDLNL
ncbi:T-kininogen 2-like isoform X2 [Engystomops pustulosus]|uniref:T-kininogen 2-like isoform X2 n=1 Tax=Engystomops pustulosus TaxID=76066 RepID=UPI003AFB7448